jgi:hypothetical protein
MLTSPHTFPGSFQTVPCSLPSKSNRPFLCETLFQPLSFHLRSCRIRDLWPFACPPCTKLPTCNCLDLRLKLQKIAIPASTACVTAVFLCRSSSAPTSASSCRTSRSSPWTVSAILQGVVIPLHFTVTSWGTGPITQSPPLLHIPRRFNSS